MEPMYYILNDLMFVFNYILYHCKIIQLKGLLFIY